MKPLDKANMRDGQLSYSKSQFGVDFDTVRGQNQEYDELMKWPLHCYWTDKEHDEACSVAFADASSLLFLNYCTPLYIFQPVICRIF